MITNLDIEKKANILIKNVGDALEDMAEAQNGAQFRNAKYVYKNAITRLMGFYDFLTCMIDTINENTECFDKEYDKIERTKKSQS